MPHLRETGFCVLFLFSTEPIIQNFSAILYIVLLHNTVDMDYLYFSDSSSKMHILQKYSK